MPLIKGAHSYGPGLALVLAVACAPYVTLERSARGSYRKGDYDTAVYSAAASLRAKPDHAAAQQLLRDAFRAAVNTHKDRIRAVQNSTAIRRWDAAAVEYAALDSLNRTVRDLPLMPNKQAPGGVLSVPTEDYSALLADARNRAAEAHYQEGVRLAASSDIQKQRLAVQEFRITENYVPGYKDAADRQQASKRAGTRRLAVIPFEDKSGYAGNFGALRDRIVDEIVGHVMNDAQATEFLEVVSREQFEQVMREQQLQVSGLVDQQTAVRLGRLLGAHDILTGRITQILYTPERTVRRTVETEAEVQVGTETVKDSLNQDVQRPVQGRVTANVTIHTRTAGASMAGSYSIVEVQTAAVRKTESFEKRRDFTCEWATYSGDKRALGDYAGLCDKPEAVAPSEAELVTGAALELSRSLAGSIRSFLK
jgi:hypothetical protein